ncbi:MAG: hypothetical protein ACLUB2_01145 [Butyricicoccus pullicaecorum]
MSDSASGHGNDELVIAQVERGLCNTVALVADDDRRAFGQSFGRSGTLSGSSAAA